MNEQAPAPQSREALVADILNTGTEILDIDPGTTDVRIHEDPYNRYRGTRVPEYDLMGVNGPEHGDELPVVLAVTLGAGRNHAPRYSFWADGSIGKLNYDAWMISRNARDSLDPVEDAELADLARQVAEARDILATRLRTGS